MLLKTSCSACPKPKNYVIWKRATCWNDKFTYLKPTSDPGEREFYVKLKWPVIERYKIQDVKWFKNFVFENSGNRIWNKSFTCLRKTCYFSFAKIFTMMCVCFGVSVQFWESVYLFCQYHTVLITGTLQGGLKTGSFNPYAVLFFFDISLTILGPLLLHINQSANI